MTNAEGSRRWAVGITAAVLTLLAASVAPAQTVLTALVNFNGTKGAYPYGSVVQGVDGNLYGTTISGGANNNCAAQGYVGCGTIYKMTPKGELTTFYAFCSQPNCVDGAGPAAGLVLGTDGNFYGTTLSGGNSAGAGTAFKITPEGVFTTLHSFCAQPSCADGSRPGEVLVQGRDGSFYGTTSSGGTFVSLGGTIFNLTAGGNFTTLHSFNGTDGLTPDALVQGADGNFYGTTDQGGAYNGGTFFTMNQAGTLVTLYDFCRLSGCPDGFAPAGLLQAGDGNFYGFTVYGGSFDQGTVFRVTPAGALTTLYSFGESDGFLPPAIFPSSLLQGTDGNLYGTTILGGDVSTGTVFRMSLSGAEVTLGTFDSYDGEYPGALAQATNGKFYGTAVRGGHYGNGTIFRLSTGLAPFISPLPQSAPAGQRVEILGHDLTGATSVTFNGTAAIFTIESPTLIKTTVPAGATSGPLQVLVPRGRLSSNVSFQVLP